MNKTNLDTLDNEIIRLLTENGRMPIGKMSKRLNVTAPTIRSRIKNLEKKGLMKVSGMIDPNQHPQMITSLVAMSIRSHGKMDQILEKIARLPNVVWAGVRFFPALDPFFHLTGHSWQQGPLSIEDVGLDRQCRKLLKGLFSQDLLSCCGWSARLP